MTGKGAMLFPVIAFQEGCIMFRWLAWGAVGLTGGVLLLLLLGARHWQQTVSPQRTPSLTIAQAIPLNQDGSATVPVAFAGDGATVASVLFSIDYDAACLVFDPADGDGNGRPDAAVFNLPPAFIPSFSYDPRDSDGEIDVVIADYSPPYATLPDSVLLTLQFYAACVPADGSAVETIVRFSTAPGASFSMPSGSSLPGVTQDGSVLITAGSIFTPPPTATPTPTPTPTATGTPTLIPTATATPDATATPTPRPTTPSLPPLEGHLDHDHDGVLSQEEGAGDLDGDGLPNYLDPDDDGDGIYTIIEGMKDPDGSGVPNFLDLDANDNGIPDAVEVGPDPFNPVDANRDGVWDFVETPKLYLPLVTRGG